MVGARDGCVVAGIAVALCALALASRAEAAPPTVEDYARALSAARLSAPAAEDLDELNALLERAQGELLARRTAAAAELLLRITDGPRFADFEDYEAFQNAEYMLSGALLDLGARTSARRYLVRLLERGQEGGYFVPAFHRAVDLGLALDDPSEWLAELERLAGDPRPADLERELAYLRGRQLYLAGDFGAAAGQLERVEPRSRFHASAQYLLGAMAAAHERYEKAEQRFCSITAVEKDDFYSFFVDDRFFPVRDLAQLGLGRVSHEAGRADDAFYYYFQVPEDSPRLDEALFEAAYASYEGKDYDAAMDALDQLDAKAPSSPFVAEGALLRGFLHLSRCEFGDAERQLVAFQQRFRPLLADIDAILQSPARQRTLHADLVARERDLARLQEAGEQGEPTPNSLLLTLLRLDPEFHALHTQLRALEDEAARMGRVPAELRALRSALGEGSPTRRAAPSSEEPDPGQLLRTLAQLRRGVSALSAERARLSRAGGDAAALEELERELSSIDAEAERLVAAQRRQLRAEPLEALPTETPTELVELLEHDAREVGRLQVQVDELREALEARADKLALEALWSLRERLAQQLRRAGIGRIDAVMGAKRRLELQVESLAAGRFPPELADPIRMQSLLRDDEEYWPFEGEDWPDEFVESYPDEEEGE